MLTSISKPCNYEFLGTIWDYIWHFLKEGGHDYVYNVRVKLRVFYCEVYEYKCGGLVIRNTN